MGSPTKKTVTLAIPTIGRFEEVRDTIEAVLKGTRLPDEILVSDQNQPSRTDLDAYLKSQASVVRHIRTAPKGVTFNMNTLLREAKGDIILYVDDDVVPSPRLVEAHAANYENGDAVGIAGRVEVPEGDRNPSEITRVGVFHRWTGKMIFDFNGRIRQPCVFAQGANMSFDRLALLEIGGFDERFDGNGYYFESDATLRMAKAYPGHFYFDPTAELLHLTAPRGGARVHDRAKLNAHFVRNGIRLFRRHCPPIVVPFLVAKLFGITLAKAIYRKSPALLIQGIKAIAKGALS